MIFWQLLSLEFFWQVEAFCNKTETVEANFSSTFPSFLQQSLDSFEEYVNQHSTYACESSNRLLNLQLLSKKRRLAFNGKKFLEKIRGKVLVV